MKLTFTREEVDYLLTTLLDLWESSVMELEESNKKLTATNERLKSADINSLSKPELILAINEIASASKIEGISTEKKSTLFRLIHFFEIEGHNTIETSLN
jgi:hypothetical protein